MSVFAWRSWLRFSASRRTASIVFETSLLLAAWLASSAAILASNWAIFASCGVVGSAAAKLAAALNAIATANAAAIRFLLGLIMGASPSLSAWVGATPLF